MCAPAPRIADTEMDISAEPSDAPKPRPLQKRAAETRARITAGVIEVLAGQGAAGCTHRAVAKAAGVSLAATTYHFDTKGAMIEAASQALLDGYVADFDRVDARLAAGEATGISGLPDLVQRVAGNALGRARIRSLAWCEIMLQGGRDPARRDSVAAWYAETDRLWLRIARHLDPTIEAEAARDAVDQVVGLTFLLHPLQPTPAEVQDLLTGQSTLSALLDRLPSDPPLDDAASPARQRVIDAAIAILIDDGVAGISYRAVAERAGLARSGPAHHFASIDALIEAAQRTLFARAKTRYRDALAGAGGPVTTRANLLDLTTAVFFREVLEHPRESVGFYSVWVVAAQSPVLRGVVAAAQRDQHRAWCRRLASLPNPPPAESTALRVQAQFIGMLIRAVAAGGDLDRLREARQAFAALLGPEPA